MIWTKGQFTEKERQEMVKLRAQPKEELILMILQLKKQAAATKRAHAREKERRHRADEAFFSDVGGRNV